MQTKAGAAKAQETLKVRLGGEEAYREHFRTIGGAGGVISRGGGFTKGSEAARAAGRAGGKASRRTNR